VEKYKAISYKEPRILGGILVMFPMNRHIYFCIFISLILKALLLLCYFTTGNSSTASMYIATV
jgi:hypothetical protein